MTPGNSSGRGQGLFYIHLAVLLFGMAGLFGKLVSLPAVFIVLGRVFFASIFLAILISTVKGAGFRLRNRKEFWSLLCLGALLAFHWFAFFHSIQLSTVAIGLLTYATFPVFTAFLEPWLFRERFDWSSVWLALIAMLGVYLIVPSPQWGEHLTMGAFWGVLSGLSFSILTILNRRLVAQLPPMQITFYQDLFAFIFLLPVLFLEPQAIDQKDWLLLIILGLVFTALAHFLYIRALDIINARTASLIASLEPVYGILFAWLLISEIPDSATLSGGLIILTVAILAGIKRSSA